MSKNNATYSEDGSFLVSNTERTSLAMDNRDSQQDSKESQDNDDKASPSDDYGTTDTLQDDNPDTLPFFMTGDPGHTVRMYSSTVKMSVAQLTFAPFPADLGTIQAESLQTRADIRKRMSGQLLKSGFLDVCDSTVLGIDPAQELPNGGFGWVVVFCSFLINFVCLGFPSSFNVLLPELIKEFEGEEVGLVSSIGSLNFAFFNLTQALSGGLVAAYGARKMSVLGGSLTIVGIILSAMAQNVWQMVLTYAILFGFGFSLAHTASIVILMQYFDKKRAKAMSLVMLGAALGQMFYPQMADFAIPEYGYKSYLLISGSSAFVLVFLPSFYLRDYRPPRHQILGNKRPKLSFKTLFNVSLFKDTEFILIAISLFIMKYGFLSPGAYIVQFATEQQGLEVPSTLERTLATFIGVGKLADRFLLVFIADRYSVLSLLCFHLFACGVLTAFAQYYSSYVGLAVYSFAYGGLHGGVISLMPLTVALYLTPQLLGQAFGLANALSAPTQYISFPAMGWIRDATGNYDLSYLAAGVSLIVCVFPLLFIPRAAKKTEKREKVVKNKLARKSVHELDKTIKLYHEGSWYKTVATIDEDETKNTPQTRQSFAQAGGFLTKP